MHVCMQGSISMERPTTSKSKVYFCISVTGCTVSYLLAHSNACHTYTRVGGACDEISPFEAAGPVVMSLHK